MPRARRRVQAENIANNAFSAPIQFICLFKIARDRRKLYNKTSQLKKLFFPKIPNCFRSPFKCSKDILI